MKVIRSTQSYTSVKAIDIPFGDCFLYGPDNRLLMRVKPVNFLLNSTLITDCINRNKVFAVSPEAGTCFIIEGRAEVIRVEVELHVKVQP